MSRRVFRITALPTLTALILAGCSLAPKYERPESPVPGQYPSYGQAAQPGPQGVAASADLGWRQFFQDQQLQALIDIALDNNRDLRIAVERVQEARAQYGIQQSE